MDTVHFFKKYISNNGFSSCGIETKVRHMQLKQTSLATRKLRRLWKWRTAAVTRRLQIVIGDTASCQTPLTTAFTLNGRFSFLR